MTFSVKYKPLFVVNILHQFFLNKGADEFLAMSNEKKAKQLLNYNISDYFMVQPTILTKQKLEGQRLVFRNTGSEIAVWTKVSETDDTEPFIPLSNDLCFSFLIKLTDSYFYNYTNWNLSDLGKLSYFSNKRLSTESLIFPLINKSGDNISVDENFILSNSGESNELANLSEREKNNLFGIIRIHTKGENASLDIINALGKISNPNKTFEILFENRKTTWRYFFKADQTVISTDDVEIESSDAKVLTTKNEQPLTQKGFVSIELGGVELPNPDFSLIKPNSTNNKIHSEIYM